MKLIDRLEELRGQMVYIGSKDSSGFVRIAPAEVIIEDFDRMDEEQTKKLEKAVTMAERNKRVTEKKLKMLKDDNIVYKNSKKVTVKPDEKKKLLEIFEKRINNQENNLNKLKVRRDIYTPLRGREIAEEYEKTTEHIGAKVILFKGFAFGGYWFEHEQYDGIDAEEEENERT